MLLTRLPRPRILDAEDAQAQLHELRAATLRLITISTGVGYLTWHILFTLVSPSDQMLRALSLVPLTAPTFVGTYVLLPRSRRCATVVFLVGSLLAITVALCLFESSRLVPLYAMVALTAAVVSDPRGGIVTTLAALALLQLVGAARPGLVDQEHVLMVVAFCGVAIVAVWSQTRHLLLALNWYSRSYATAEHQTREAQNHRAQLVQAWRQLDSAYYRLERTSAALQLAWKAADEAERSKTEFAVHISHELRTPLNLIVGYSEMMMTSPENYGGVALPVQYRGDMNAVYQSAQHLLTLTDDVLDLGRMEIGHLGLVRESIDLGRVVRDAAELVGDYISSKGLQLHLAIPDELPPLQIDRLRIRQVLLNLLTNAARFTERGGIRVEVTRREHEIAVAVVDTGPGIPPEDLPHVFDQFATRGRSQSEWHAGTGLGLPISKRFVELHGGEMGVESVVGEGTTFWFTLPLAAVDGVVHWASGDRPRACLSRLDQVLIVASPDPEFARLLERHLDGYRVETAADLEQALARCAEQKPAAIIADLDDPADSTGCPVPVVRFRLPEAGRLAEQLGIADYLVKPVSREALLSAIRKLAVPVNRILIVDDDARFVRFLSRVLLSAAAGYQVSAAHTGDEALVKLRVEHVDLVLLDLVMPGLDGFGVLKQMAAEPDLRHTSVIAISASGDRVEKAPLGDELRIRKPGAFQRIELIEVVGAVVEKLAPPTPA